MRENNSTTIKHSYNEFANLANNWDDIAIDTNDWWNHPKTVPVIGMKSIVTRARLRDTHDYLPSGICSLINPAAMAKLISFSAQIPTVMLWRVRMG